LALRYRFAASSNIGIAGDRDLAMAPTIDDRFGNITNSGGIADGAQN
jgi:hypothetical protein